MDVLGILRTLRNRPDEAGFAHRRSPAGAPVETPHTFGCERIRASFDIYAEIMITCSPLASLDEPAE